MPFSWVPLKSIVTWRSLAEKKNRYSDIESPIVKRHLLINGTLPKEDTRISLGLKSPKKSNVDVNTLVCQMSESPFRILRMAARGNLQGVERLFSEDPSRVNTIDGKGWTPLHHAAANDRDVVIRFLAANGADLNAKDLNEQTPLHLATIRNNGNAVRSLIECGADSSITDKTHKSALHLAAIHNKPEILSILASYPEKVNLYICDEDGRTALHITAIHDFDEAAQILLDNYKKCPNQPCHNGFYPIHMAAKNASVNVLEVLLKWAVTRGCERRKMIATPDVDGNVPLHLAVHGGDIKAVQLCLENGADISWTQQDNSTPVHLACSQGALDIVKLMFSQQPEEKAKVLGITDAQGMTPLHCAAMFDHSELVSFLIKEGADVNMVDMEHRTPLLLAASQKCWKVVKILLKQGADPVIRDSANKNILHVVILNGGGITDILSLGETAIMPHLAQLMNEQDVLGCSPMHYASRSGHTRSLASLIQLGASVRIKNEKNESPLHFAARYGRYNTVRQLLESVNGFLIMNESDGAGRTALHIASREGHTRVVRLLLSKGALLHRDHFGKTPLHHAALGGHNDTITTLLTVWGHLLDQVDKEGNTPLHLAVRSNKPETVSQLLSLNCKMVPNNCSYKPIDIAIQSKLHESAVAMVTHERGPKEILQTTSVVHGCVSIALIRALPKVFEAALNQSITRARVKEDAKDFYIKYSFYPLQMVEEEIKINADMNSDPNWRPPPLYSCNEMVASGRVDLLMHPLTQKFLEMKWHAYGMHIHLLNLALYFFYLISVTSFASNLMLHSNNKIPCSNVSMDDYNYTDQEELHAGEHIQIKHPGYKSVNCFLTAIAILVFAFFGMARELFQIYHLRFQYFTVTPVEWILYVTSVCMVLPLVTGGSYGDIEYNSAAVAVFTAWFTLLLYFQRFDRIGLYIIMFLEILNTLLKVVAIFSVLIVAFSLSFYILLSKGNHLAYSSVPVAMIKTVAMMLGEIDFMNSFVYPYFNESVRTEMRLPYPRTTLAILVVFMILMPILLMNLLIGLAVGDIESVKKNAQMKRIAMQVELHKGLEEKIPGYLIRKVDKEEVIVYPNDDINRNNFVHKFLSAINLFTPFSDQTELETFEGSCAEELLFEELEGQHKRFRDMQNQLDQQLKLLRLIMQKMDITSEADETDEGVSLEDIVHPPRHHRRWTSASSARRMISLRKSESQSSF